MTKEESERQTQLVETKRLLEKLKFDIDFGRVTIQIREKQPTLITLEKTIRLD